MRRIEQSDRAKKTKASGRFGRAIGAPRIDRTPVARLDQAGPGQPEPIADLADHVGHHVTSARDLVDAVRKNRQPLCNVHEAAMTVEMICGVFESHRQGGRAVAIPLKERGNALAKL